MQSSAKIDELRGLYTQSRVEIKEARDESKLFLRELHHAQEKLQQSVYSHRDQHELLLKHQRLYSRLTDLFVHLLD